MKLQHCEEIYRYEFSGSPEIEAHHNTNFAGSKDNERLRTLAVDLLEHRRSTPLMTLMS
jgi:hypothetical protein